MFNEPMDPVKPLAVYTQAFVADIENPVTIANIVQMGVTHAVATGVMWEAYHKWKSIPQVDHN